MAAHLLEGQTIYQYVVHGICRKNSVNLNIVEEMSRHCGRGRLVIHFGDVTDPFFMLNLIQEVQPDEVYNLAA